MSRIGRLRFRCPAVWTSPSTAARSTSRAPRARCATRSPRPSPSSATRTARCRCSGPNDERESRALHGLSRTLIANMITGVTEGYTKTLEIVGVGYRVQARGSDLEFALGFSHPVPVQGPRGHHLHRRVAHPPAGHRHRQAAGRRGRGQDPQDPQARPVQGQGRAVPGRGRQAQGREDGQVMAQAAISSGQDRRGHKPVGTDISTARRVSRLRRHNRLRKRVAGTPERPRLVVKRSSRHIHVQVVDDTAGHTLVSASTMDAEPARRRGRQVRPGPPGRCAGRRAGQGRRDHRGRLRPRWQPVRRAHRGAGRRRPRGRAGLLMTARRTQLTQIERDV